MATQYFFTHGTTQYGPYSGLQLRDLAAAGKIEPTDTVWRQGVGVPIPAARVKFLFAELVAHDSAGKPALSSTEPAAAVLPQRSAASVEKPAQDQARPQSAFKERPRRVITIKGGVLIGQDGRQVHYRKKCGTCGTEDQCRSTAVIRPGAMKISYFCRKCRKGRCVEMVGTN